MTKKPYQENRVITEDTPLVDMVSRLHRLIEKLYEPNGLCSDMGQIRELAEDSNRLRSAYLEMIPILRNAIATLQTTLDGRIKERYNTTAAPKQPTKAGKGQ